MKPRIFGFDSITPMVKKASLVLSGVAVFTIPCQASDRDSGFYTGFALTSIAAEEGGASSRGTGVALIGGYSYSNYFSTELSLLNIGDHKELGMKGNGLSLSVIGSYPINKQFTLFGEFGGMTVDLEINENQHSTNAPSDEASLFDGRDSSFYYAFGAQYHVKNWSLALKNAQVDLDADLDVFYAQVSYHF